MKPPLSAGWPAGRREGKVCRRAERAPVKSGEGRAGNPTDPTSAVATLRWQCATMRASESHRASQRSQPRRPGPLRARASVNAGVGQTGAGVQASGSLTAHPRSSRRLRSRSCPCPGQGKCADAARGEHSPRVRGHQHYTRLTDAALLPPGPPSLPRPPHRRRLLPLRRCTAPPPAKDCCLSPGLGSARSRGRPHCACACVWTAP